jgi:Na+/proline symporter
MVALSAFTAIDYVVFSGMLAICTFIGLYFGYLDYRERKKGVSQSDYTVEGNDEAANYLLGGRDMPLLPIALSLTASFVSGTVILGKVFGINKILKNSRNLHLRYCH